MLLIWGWKTRCKTLADGVFFCPTCGGDRHYRHQQARRWFTIFFLPVIPLKQLGEFIECQTCKSGYHDTILRAPTTATLQADLVTSYREAMVWILRNAANPASGRTVALAVLTDVSGQQWTPEMLDADVNQLSVDGLFPRLTALGGSLTEQGKEGLLAACTRVAAGGEVIETGARQLLEQMAAALTMTPAHARGVIDSTVESLR